MIKDSMITSTYKQHIEELKAIDAKCYLWPWLDEGWADSESYIFRVLLDTDSFRVKGFTCCKVIENNKILFVNKLCVRPCYQKQGNGSQLMHDLMLLAKQKSITVLETILHEENAHIEWARKWDWTCSDLVRGCFPDGRDGYRMIRRI